MGKCELQSSRSVARNWNFLPSILLRIALHSITSPSSSFQLWWNQRAAAASWPSKSLKEMRLFCSEATTEELLNCQERPFFCQKLKWTQLTALQRYEAYVVKKNVTALLERDGQAIFQSPSNFCFAVQKGVQRALCLMGMLCKSRVGHLARQDTKWQRTKLVPFFACKEIVTKTIA